MTTVGIIATTEKNIGLVKNDPNMSGSPTGESTKYNAHLDIDSFTGDIGLDKENIRKDSFKPKEQKGARL